MAADKPHTPAVGHPSQEGTAQALSEEKSPLQRGGAERRGVSESAPLPYNPRLKLLARELRYRSTLAEVLLWKHLRGRQRLGFDFHRQKPILEWIADFYSAELKLVVEIDGESHRFRSADDQAKDAALHRLGLTVLRFGDAEVKRNAAWVAEEIDRWILRQDEHQGGEHTPACGHPSQEGIAQALTKEKSPLERGGAKRRGV
jgi:very-short-patch-repair endonuclease